MLSLASESAPLSPIAAMDSVRRLVHATNDTMEVARACKSSAPPGTSLRKLQHTSFTLLCVMSKLGLTIVLFTRETT
eukprot:4435506-Pyramimonas_sp.AAC.2